MGQYPDPEDLAHFITWEVLQEALVSERKQQQQDLQAVSPPPSSRGGTPPLSQSGGSRPKGIRRGAERYPETVDALRGLGRLGQRHEALGGRVAQLEASKADHTQLQHLKEVLNDVGKNSSFNYTARHVFSHLYQEIEGAAILQLQAECEKLHTTTCQLVEEQNERQQHIQVSRGTKADKQALETKVSQVQFDSMTEQLSSMFQDLLSKISGQEQDWHKVIQKISMEMECKLNRIELDPLKQQLEERWKAIRKQLQAPPAPELDDAAGIRKQLVARFHCISCDRPVDMMTPGPHLVTVPSAPGLPSHRSSRPYTVYELEQVRQHCRSDKIPEMTDYSYLAMSRSCGGSHTLTYPNRRYTRLQHIAQAVRSVESRLPTISPKEGICKNKDKVNRSQSQKSSADPVRTTPVRPQSAKTQWSHSVSGSSMRDRPMSSLGCLSQSSAHQGSTHMDPAGEAPQGLVLHVDLSQSGEEEPGSRGDPRFGLAGVGSAVLCQHGGTDGEVLCEEYVRTTESGRGK
ncbi:hypothetical protein JZ751_013107 [Albula glossodonta]|uniref:DUF4795 domain-containing protein n=1 Tax=Albula glossodonta TaxID=121402 RepID=A0A8T2NU39_9TELE|nr:hypothetical protein JZ751_013107 [Albula glossodonta]